MLLLTLMPLVSAATLQGRVYDYTLESLENVIITVDTSPRQQYISKDATYEFDLPPGTYTVNASHWEAGQLRHYSQEVVTVKDNGTFVFDLILFPYLLDDEELVHGIEIDVSDVTGKRKSPLLYAALLLCAAAGAGIYYFARKKSAEPDSIYDEVVAVIQREKRVSQKDLRKALAYSEAKISLVVSEMEKKGVVTKIRKGRGNIIVLNR